MSSSGIGLRRYSLRTYLLGIFVYSLAWSPVFGVFGDRPYLTILFAGLICPLVVCLGMGFHQRFPRWTRVLRIPYWLFLLGIQLVFIVFAICMDPVYFWVSVGLSLAVCLLPNKKRRATYVLIPAVLVVTFVTAVDLRFHSLGSALILVGGGLAGAGMLWWILRRGSSVPISGVGIAFAVYCLLIYPRSFVLYRFAFPGYASIVISQPGVRAVYTYAEGETGEEIPQQIMYMARMRASDTFVMGPQKPYHQLCFLHADEEPRLTKLEIWSRGSDNLAFDPEDSDLLYIGAGNWFHKIAADRPAIIDSIRLDVSSHNKNFIQYDEKGDRFFISEDFGDQVFVVDRRTFRTVETIPSPEGTRTDDVWIDPVGDLIWVDARYLIGRRVDTYDRKTLKPSKTYLWPWDCGFNFSTLDPHGRRAYLASGLSGRVRVLDLDTLEPLYTFRLKVGIRNVNFDADRRWLLIGNYFRGRLSVYDVDRRAWIGDLFLGTRLRWVEVDPESRKWYATSSVGGFQVSPEEAFPSNPSSKPLSP